MPFFTSFSACSCKGAGRQATTVATRGCQQQQQHAQLLRHITAKPATRSRHHGTVKSCASTLNTGISKGLSTAAASGRSQTAAGHAATAPSPDSYSAAQESTAQQNSSKAHAGSTSSATLPLTPRDARVFFVRLATYRPQQLVERRWQLPQACPYSPALFQQAADAAAAQPRAVLGGLSDQQLAYVAAAYAAAQHPHAGLMQALSDTLAQAMYTRAAALAAAQAAQQAHAQNETPDMSQHLQRLPSPNDPRLLTLRSAGAMAGAYARLGARHVPLFRALSAWLKGAFRGGALRPKAKSQGLWLSVLLWSFSQLALYDAALWEELSRALQAQPKWVTLLDANDVLRLAWAARRVRHHDPLLMRTLQLRATTQVGRLSMHDLGAAWVTLASAGWSHPDVLEALAKSLRVKARSLPPAVLVATLAALAALRLADEQQRQQQQAGSGRSNLAAADWQAQRGVVAEEVDEPWRVRHLCLPDKQLLELLDLLAVWSANKMVNFRPSEAAAALHAMACLRYRNAWALYKICAALAGPKRNALARMSNRQLLVVMRSLVSLGFTPPWLVRAASAAVATRMSSLPPQLGKGAARAGEPGQNASQNHDRLVATDSDDALQLLAAVMAALAEPPVG